MGQEQVSYLEIHSIYMVLNSMNEICCLTKEAYITGATSRLKA